MKELRLKTFASNYSYWWYSLIYLLSWGSLKKRSRFKRYHIKNRKFEQIFSLGDRCLTSQILIENDLRQWAGPYDWFGGGDLDFRLNLLLEHFVSFLERDNLVIDPDQVDLRGMVKVEDKKLGVRFLHDFSLSNFDLSYISVFEKYSRRILRLYNKSANSDVLMVYIDTTNADKDESLEFAERAIEVKNVLKAKTLSILYCRASMSSNDSFDSIDLEGCGGKLFRLVYSVLNEKEVYSPPRRCCALIHRALLTICS